MPQDGLPRLMLTCASQFSSPRVMPQSDWETGLAPSLVTIRHAI